MRKHSYRELSRRDFNSYILHSLRDEADAQETIDFYKHYNDHRQKVWQTALEAARTLKQEFKTLGKSLRLGNYAPYTNEIKQELFKTLQITLF